MQLSSGGHRFHSSGRRTKVVNKKNENSTKQKEQIEIKLNLIQTPEKNYYSNFMQMSLKNYSKIPKIYTKKIKRKFLKTKKL